MAAWVLLQEASVVGRLAELAVTSADPRELSSTLVHSGGGLLILLGTRSCRCSNRAA